MTQEPFVRSIKAQYWGFLLPLVAGSPQLTPIAKLTHAMILGRGSGRPIQIHQDRLAEDLAVSPRTIHGAIRDLEKCGMLVVVRGARNKPASYQARMTPYTEAQSVLLATPRQ